MGFGYTVITGKIDPTAVEKSLTDFSAQCTSRLTQGWVPTGGIAAGKMRVYQAFTRSDMIGGSRRKKRSVRSTRRR